jgi:hypothetical protein
MDTLKRIVVVAVMLAAGVAASGCDEETKSSPLAPSLQANVMAVHASPDAPAVDLLVDNAVAGTGLAFPNSTPYLPVAAGVRNVKVNVAGTANSVINENVTVAGGMNYTVFACDSVSKIGAIVLGDDLTPPAPGKAHVRFVHLSPNAPAVDVAVQGGPVLFANKAFKEYSAFTPVDAGTYDLEVRLAGTGTAVLPLNGKVLQAGKIYTVFARGFVGGAGGQALDAQIILNN